MGTDKIAFSALRSLILTSKESRLRSNSRRNMLKKLGITLVSWNPAVDLINDTLHQRPVLHHSHHKLTIAYNHHNWIIDKSLLGGHPRYRVQQNEKEIRIRLKGSRFPGLQLSPDFIATLKPGTWGWQLHIRFDKLGIDQQLSLDEWLNGKTVRGSIPIDEVIKLDHSDSISIRSLANVEISYDWQLHVRLRSKMKLTFSGESLRFSGFELSPNLQDTKLKSPVSFLNFTLPGKGIHKPVPINSDRISNSSEKTSQQINALLFDKEKSYYQNTLLAYCGKENSPAYYYHPFVDEASLPLNESIVSVHYGERKSIELQGKVGHSPSWINIPGAALCLHDEPEVDDNFQLTIGDNGNELIACAVPLAGTRIGIEGAVSLPVQSLPQQIILSGEANSSPNIQINPQVRYTRLQLDVPIRLSMLRAEDLVELSFEFYNCRYTNKQQQSFVELRDANKPGYMVVYFPPQHILEEAFFRTSELKTNEPGANATGSNQPIALPAKFETAGKSRLVFELSKEFEGMPLIVNQLLSWERFKLRINPRAWLFTGLNTTRMIIPANIRRFRKPAQISIPKNMKPLNISIIRNTEKATESEIRIAAHSRKQEVSEQRYEEQNAGKFLPAQVPTLTQLRQMNFANMRPVNFFAPPTGMETSLEIPGRLFISPNQLAGFRHILQVINSYDDSYRPKTSIQLKPMMAMRRIGSSANSEATQEVPYQNQIFELWHTRMGVQLKSGEVSEEVFKNLSTIRAIWSRDVYNGKNLQYPGNNVEIPFRASLNAKDRNDLVHQTSHYGADFTPRAVAVNRLMLSALGGWLDAHGNFDYKDIQDAGFSLIDWKHLATLGRDQFVRVVRRGYLFPFGHEAALIKITQREFDEPTRSAADIQRMFVVVREPEFFYDPYTANNQFNAFPFQSIRLVSLVTPAIDLPTSLVSSPAQNFLINVGSSPFRFKMEAVDKEGTTIHFRCPMVFIEDYADFLGQHINDVIKIYNQTDENNNSQDDIYQKVRTTELNGQQIAYADSILPDDTSLETVTLRFKAKPYSYPGTRMNFYPEIDYAEVLVKAAEEFTGQKQPVKIELYDDRNEGTVWSKMWKDEKLPIDFNGGADKTGGFLSPNISVSGLSKIFGPVSGDVNYIAGLSFEPDKFFPVTPDIPGFNLPKIFGALPLGKLLNQVNLGASAFNQLKNQLSSYREQIDEVRKQILLKQAELEKAIAENKNGDISKLKDEIATKTNQLQSLANQVRDFMNGQTPRIPNLKTYRVGNSFVAEYRWQPEFNKTTKVFDGFIALNANDPNNTLTINNRMVKSIHAQTPPQVEVMASMQNFNVSIGGMIAVDFRKLTFKAGTQTKKDVKVQLGAVPLRFLGPLSFVNGLQQIIPAEGFGEGVTIKLEGAGIRAGYDLKIPPIEVGIFSLANVSLGASLYLPFTGDPLTLGFNFCSRQNPFLLRVSLFGGGGFFALQTSIAGLTKLEAAFEFSAGLSLNVGVASGGVQVAGGFYYSIEYENDQSISKLSGYLRINGNLSILGIITLSMEFYLSLNAIIVNKMVNGETVKKVEKMIGEASVKVKIEVLFFSKSVTVKVRRELRAADADPLFSDTIPEPAWLDYCKAFA